MTGTLVLACVAWPGHWRQKSSNERPDKHSIWGHGEC